MIIRAEAYGSGYTSSTAEKTVTVAYNSGRPAAPAVTPAEQNVAAGNRAGFEIPTAGDDWSADRIVVRYYRSGYSSNVRYSELEPSSQGNTTTWSDYSRGAGEEWKYAFAVRVDSVWSRWSNTCTANTDI